VGEAMKNRILILVTIAVLAVVTINIPSCTSILPASAVPPGPNPFVGAWVKEGTKVPVYILFEEREFITFLDSVPNQMGTYTYTDKQFVLRTTHAYLKDNKQWLAVSGGATIRHDYLFEQDKVIFTGLILSGKYEKDEELSALLEEIL
jgi:hypothetical protein